MQTCTHTHTHTLTHTHTHTHTHTTHMHTSSHTHTHRIYTQSNTSQLCETEWSLEHSHSQYKGNNNRWETTVFAWSHLCPLQDRAELIWTVLRRGFILQKASHPMSHERETNVLSALHQSPHRWDYRGNRRGRMNEWMNKLYFTRVVE